VQELALENKKMREEISELHKHLTKGLKKVNILEWLNTDPQQEPPKNIQRIYENHPSDPKCGPHINE
jgi:hypothetical protein